MFIFEIKDRLVAQGVGVYNTSIFIGSKAQIPDGAGPYISLTETGGTGSSKTQNDTAAERPTAQILTRASDYSVAQAKAYAAYNALGGPNGLYNQSLGGVYYVSMTSRQVPTEIGLDDKKRVMFSFNIDVEKYPS